MNQEALQVAPRREATTTRRSGAGTLAASRSSSLELRPAIDVLENGDGMRILADVPGVSSECANIEIEAGRLRIECTRRARDGSTVRYATSLLLPDTIDASSLTAELRNGVLQIAMARSEAARPRRIEVRSA